MSVFSKMVTEKKKKQSNVLSEMKLDTKEMGQRRKHKYNYIWISLLGRITYWVGKKSQRLSFGMRIYTHLSFKEFINSHPKTQSLRFFPNPICDSAQQ